MWSALVLFSHLGDLTEAITVGPPSPTPSNGYVTEDGTVFYVAEDSATFYVQES